MKFSTKFPAIIAMSVAITAPGDWPPAPTRRM
jgi:hypothetical protein